MQPGRNILIIGSPGAGKSVLARALADRLGLPIIHLDRLYWRPGWVEVPRETFMADLEKALGSEGWICDGNYSFSLELRTSRADTVIWLDIPRWRCMWRIIWRVFEFRGRTRPDMAPDCPERLHWPFLVWTWNFEKRNRAKLERLLTRNEGRLVQYRLRSPAEVRAFLKSLEGD